MSRALDLRGKRGVIFAVYCTLILLTLIFIFGNSILSGEDSSRHSGFLADLLRPIFNPGGTIPDVLFEHIIRKLAHFTEFALLGFELTLLFIHLSDGFKARDAVYSAFAGLLSANVDELIQLFSKRGSMVSDVFIDFSGVIFGIALGYAVSGIIKTARKKKQAHKGGQTE